MKKNTEKKKKSGGNKVNLIICAISFVALLVYVFFIDKPENIIGAFKVIDVKYLGLCIITMAAYWFCEAASTHNILKPLCPAVKFRHTWYDTIIGQYFNCITPSATGGQPMQAYYYVKFGVPLGSAVTALLSRFIVYQFVLTLVSVGTLVFGFKTDGKILIEGGLMPLVFLGFTINTVVIVFLLCIALWKKGTAKAVNGLITLLTKMHIIKNPMHWRLYYTREVNKFHENFGFIKKNAKVIIRSFFITVIQLLLYLSISFLLYRGFYPDGDLSWGKIITYQSYVQLFSTFMPLPGAMGAAELGYVGFFSKIFGSYTSAATMLWRIYTFYLPIIVGICHLLTLKREGITAPDKEEMKNFSDQMSRENEQTDADNAPQ